MANSTPAPPPPSPNHLVPLVLAPLLPTKTAFTFPRRLPIIVTFEFDSDGFVFFHKISCKFLNKLAKLNSPSKTTSMGISSNPKSASSPNTSPSTMMWRTRMPFSTPPSRSTPGFSLELPTMSMFKTLPFWSTIMVFRYIN